MTPPSASRVRALSIHASYACRSTGVCCSSGWEIPVEPETRRRIAAGLDSGGLRVLPRAGSGPAREWRRRAAGLPHGAREVLLQDVDGACVFLDRGSRLCAVHRDLGDEALPSACRHFPRVATLTPLGVSVVLSHHCPTAAALLFAPVLPRGPGRPVPERSAVSIVEDPPAFPPSWPWEGLDARESLPPLLRPGVLMDWPSFERWEGFAVSVLAADGRTPEAALDVLAGAAEVARRWTPRDGPFGESFAGVLDEALRGETEGERPACRPARGDGTRHPRDSARWGSRAWRLLADCVPRRALLPPAPEGVDDADARWVASGWSTLGLPVRRWLATKAFASWLALQGEGLRTTTLGLRVALGVLRAEAARGCAEAGRPLDAALLKEAVRRADLLLVHLADPEALAGRLSRRERAVHPAAPW